MTDDSFTLNSVDVYDLAKLKVVAYDVLTPPLRPRKAVIPGRSGAYDYGSKYHDERGIRLECVIEGEITTAQFDSLKYTLSRKGRLILWDKPDRYFWGQFYEAATVLDFPGHCMREFTLTFVCDPYGYALVPSITTTTDNMIDMKKGGNPYAGTQEAPTRITIYNLGETTMRGIEIIARQKQ